MGIFRRITDIIAANVNDLIDRAEDPEKMAKQIIREMEESIGEVRGQVARAMAAEHQLAAQLNAARTDAAEWERRAMRAVELNKDDLARQALLRRREAERTIRALEPQLDRSREATELLRQQLRVLEDRIMMARRKRDTIIARQRMAQAQAKVNRSLGNLDRATSAMSRLASAADRVDEMEARLAAETVLIGSTDFGLEDQFERLEQDSSVDAELEALKERVNRLPSPDAEEDRPQLDGEQESQETSQE